MLNYYFTNKMFQIKGSPQHHANIFYAFNRAMSRDLANHLKKLWMFNFIRMFKLLKFKMKLL